MNKNSHRGGLELMAKIQISPPLASQLKSRLLGGVSLSFALVCQILSEITSPANLTAQCFTNIDKILLQKKYFFYISKGTLQKNLRIQLKKS